MIFLLYKIFDYFHKNIQTRHLETDIIKIRKDLSEISGKYLSILERYITKEILIHELGHFFAISNEELNKVCIRIHKEDYKELTQSMTGLDQNIKFSTGAVEYGRYVNVSFKNCIMHSISGYLNKLLFGKQDHILCAAKDLCSVIDTLLYNLKQDYYCLIARYKDIGFKYTSLRKDSHLNKLLQDKKYEEILNKYFQELSEEDRQKYLEIANTISDNNIGVYQFENIDVYQSCKIFFALIGLDTLQVDKSENCDIIIMSQAQKVQTLQEINSLMEINKNFLNELQNKDLLQICTNMYKI